MSEPAKIANRVQPGPPKKAVEAVRVLVRGYVALFRLSWSELLQYRASVFLWTLWSLAGPIIHLSVWSSIIRAEGPLAGYDGDSIVAYFLVQSIVYHFTSSWQVWDFSYLIRNGTLSARLLRPFDPSHDMVVGNAAFKLINLVWLIPIWTGMFLYFRPALSLTWDRALWFSVSLFLSAALQFLWMHCWTMISFWTVRAASLYEFVDVISYFLGGGFAPIALLPASLRAVAQVLPQYFIAGFPIEVAIGVAGPDQIVPGIVATGVWTVVFFVIYRILWRLGLKRYGAVGA